jgi:hypothetical protein
VLNQCSKLQSAPSLKKLYETVQDDDDDDMASEEVDTDDDAHVNFTL